MISLLFSHMNQLNPSVYSSLQDYQETYEFYRTRQEIPELLRFKALQTFWDADHNEHNKAA